MGEVMINHKNYDYLIKLLMIGSSGAGKSNILLRYTDETYTQSFIPTIGIDFKIKTIVQNNKKIKLQIWDTAGQERFKTITDSYYHGAMGIFIVYDITDPISFESVENWMKCIDYHAQEHCCKLLIGNKCDLEDERAISHQKGEDTAKEYNIKFIETSAKTGVNINEAFTILIDDVVKKMEEKKCIGPNSPSLEIKEEKSMFDSCCK
ncbi:MAG: putative ras-related protein Rab-10-like protein [Edafosvirus sp.]|uniref:Putative ras-related protein Rab-10-like protein n=1 Tax=Edafosvirus sp. TaxID=2487765 RepID=A0A3G4ZVP4_9VIRU|nr:MAG: putative ras-related protein Rab-10-like protein [Edafosvirus sp.]